MTDDNEYPELTVEEIEFVRRHLHFNQLYTPKLYWNYHTHIIDVIEKKLLISEGTTIVFGGEDIPVTTYRINPDHPMIPTIVAMESL